MKQEIRIIVSNDKDIPKDIPLKNFNNLTKSVWSAFLVGFLKQCNNKDKIESIEVNTYEDLI